MWHGVCHYCKNSLAILVKGMLKRIAVRSKSLQKHFRKIMTYIVTQTHVPIVIRCCAYTQGSKILIQLSNIKRSMHIRHRIKNLEVIQDDIIKKFRFSSLCILVWELNHKKYQTKLHHIQCVSCMPINASSVHIE